MFDPRRELSLGTYIEKSALQPRDECNENNNSRRQWGAIAQLTSFIKSRRATVRKDARASSSCR